LRRRDFMRGFSVEEGGAGYGVFDPRECGRLGEASLPGVEKL